VPRDLGSEPATSGRGAHGELSSRQETFGRARGELNSGQAALGRGAPVNGTGSQDAADLLSVGAGAKAAALAAKVHVLNTLDLARVRMTIVEANEPAASWTGRNGMTTGEEPLAIPPIKDVGFPYRSRVDFGAIGAEIDAAMLAFSWQRYMIEKDDYTRWVNAGSPTIRHGDYGRYLAWVLSRATAGVELLSGRVTQVALGAHEHGWVAETAEPSEPRRYACRALLLTGPGVHRAISHDSEATELIFHCDSRRSELARIPHERSPDIAIVGGGESALSCLAFLRAFRPRAQLTVYTPLLPMSRGESFLENRVFSDPDTVAWEALDEQTRRDFVRHCDRGVFDPGTLASIAYDEHCRFVAARVVHVGMAGRDDGVRVDHVPAGGELESEHHDFLVNCTGFDLLEQLRSLFAPALRAEIERRVGPVWDGPVANQVPIGRHLEVLGMHPRLHIPGLGGLAQGPGFANLGCLGLLANRVLQPILGGVQPSVPRGQATTGPATLRQTALPGAATS
jgi:mycobactin lysine-N-oxygenase